MTARGWVGVDFDGTLARWHGRMEPLGEPVGPMVEMVKRVLEDGKYDVKIFTARAVDPVYVKAVQEWALEVFKTTLEVTNCKDFLCVEIWDDRARQCDPATGRLVGRSAVLDDIDMRTLRA